MGQAAKIQGVRIHKMPAGLNWSGGHHGVYHAYDPLVENQLHAWRATISVYGSIATFNILVPDNSGFPNLLLYSIKGVCASFEDAKRHVEENWIRSGWASGMQVRRWLKYYELDEWRNKLFSKYRDQNYHYKLGWDFLTTQEGHYGY